jgi:6-phosphofructokinase 2
MRSIVTLTMNPAVDESTSVPYVLPDRKLRCQPPTYEPGGGGINVARAIRKLGGDALACFPVAGPAGELLKQLLDTEGVRYTAIAVTRWTRENLNVMEEVSGRQFRFCMPGPTLDDREWPVFLDWLQQLRPSPDFLVASGSLPPGVPVDFYARLAALGRQMEQPGRPGHVGRATGSRGRRRGVSAEAEPPRVPDVDERARPGRVAAR